MANIIPGAPAERILRNAGAKRVSEQGKQEMANVIEDFAMKIASQAVMISKNCGRKTVLGEDIKMVKL